MPKETNPKATGKRGKNAARPNAVDTLQIEAKPDERPEKTLARVALDPGVRHASLAMAFAQPVFGDQHKASIMDSTEVLAESLTKAEAGDKRMTSRLLASQAISLDAMFTELGRRSANNLGQYLDASDRYMRLALKAQTACRATLESLAKLHQPREQTVKHVHVNEGGQAVIADQFHHHRGSEEIGKSNDQSHATGAAGVCAPLPGQDTGGNGVPIPGGTREAAMPDARRDKSRPS